MTHFLFHWLIPVLTAGIGILLVTIIASVAWDTLYGHNRSPKA